MNGSFETIYFRVCTKLGQASAFRNVVGTKAIVDNSYARILSMKCRGLLYTEDLSLRVHVSSFEVYTSDEMIHFTFVRTIRSRTQITSITFVQGLI